MGRQRYFYFHKFPNYVFFIFFIYIVSKLIVKLSKNADVGPQRPANLQPYDRLHPAAPVPAPQDAAADVLAELEHDLDRLTVDIPETTMDDIPIRLQRFVVTVPGPFRRFLRKVARTVVSYREHHQ